MYIEDYTAAELRKEAAEREEEETIIIGVKEDIMAHQKINVILNKKGQTKLSKACLDDNIDEVRLLLRSNALSVLEENWNGSIALHVAAKYSSFEIVELVFEVTPKKYRSALNQYNKSPLICAQERGEDTGDEASSEYIRGLLDSKQSVIALLER